MIKLSMKKIVGSGYGDFWKTKKRYRVCKGSRGSKKSKTTALSMIVNLLKYPQANALVIRRFAATLRDSCFSDLRWAMSRLKVEEYFDCRVSPLEIVYKPTGQKILFRGLDDPLKITSISVPVGVLCFVWIEEAYELSSEDDFNKLDMSIRGELPDGLFKQITLTFNPWNSTSWVKARFFDAPDENTFVKTTTWECNEWLDEADRHLFEVMRETNPRRYRVEGLGEWGITEGLIYSNFEQCEFDTDELRRHCTAAFGLDFGYTDPNAFVCCLIDDSERKIYIFDELYEPGLTNEEIAAAIKSMGYGSERIICDSAEPKSIDELYRLGIKAEPARKGRDSVNYGIQMIQNYRLVVHPRCQNVWIELNNYAWAKDRSGNATGKPDHEFSHSMDALRYAVMSAVKPETFSFE